jgi:hypothetical protein
VQVREASEEALAAVLKTITTPELLRIMKAIHAAHLQPHAQTEALINDLLEVRRSASLVLQRHRSLPRCALPGNGACAHARARARSGPTAPTGDVCERRGCVGARRADPAHHPRTQEPLG